MKHSMKIGCVAMAAGNAKRFGSNKLAVEFQGHSLFQHALKAVPAQQFASVVVVTQFSEFLDVVNDFNFTAFLNKQQDLGLSHTLQLGLSHLQNCDGVLFQVADQPLLRQESISALIAFWQKQPEKIAALAHSGQRGNPVLFPARFYPELMAIRGDQGGSAVIRNHPNDLILLETPEEELFDVDTIQSLEQLQVWPKQS